MFLHVHCAASLTTVLADRNAFEYISSRTFTKEFQLRVLTFTVKSKK